MSAVPRPTAFSISMTAFFQGSHEGDGRARLGIAFHRKRDPGSRIERRRERQLSRIQSVTSGGKGRSEHCKSGNSANPTCPRNPDRSPLARGTEKRGVVVASMLRPSTKNSRERSARQTLNLTHWCTTVRHKVWTNTYCPPFNPIRVGRLSVLCLPMWSLSPISVKAILPRVCRIGRLIPSAGGSMIDGGTSYTSSVRLSAFGFGYLVTLASVLATPVAMAAADGPASIRECHVRGEAVYLRNVEIWADGQRTLAINGGPIAMSVRLPRPNENRMRVTLGGSLSFEVGWDALPVRAKRSEMTSNSMVAFLPGAEMWNARWRKAWVVGDTILDTVAQGYAWISQARMSCDGFSLDESMTTDDADRDRYNLWVDTAGWRVLSRGSRLPLRARPGESPVLWIRRDCAGNCDDHLRATVLEQRGRWSRIELRGPSTAVRGWVRSTSLVREDEGIADASTCCSNSNKIVAAVVQGRSTPPDPNPPYVGKAIVAAGTKVSDAPEGPSWARIERDVELRVQYRRGEAWVLLMDLPGTERADVSLPEAYVRAARVTIPGLLPGSTREH
jgi:hypothetical protein